MTTNENKITDVKKKIIISMCAIILLVLTLVGITYAYFTSMIHGNKNPTSVEITAASLKLEYDGEDSYVEVNGLYPGEKIASKTFSVKNTGTAIIENYDVILENLVNQLVRYEDLTYKLTCTSNFSNKGNTCNGDSDIFPKINQVIATNSIEPEEIHSYVLTLTYEDTYTNQSVDMNKEVSAKINIKDDYSNIKTFKVYGNYSVLESPLNNSNIIEFLGNYDTSKNKYVIPLNIDGNLINILLDEPLRKVGDVSDYIDLENRIVVRNVGEKIFDGSEDFSEDENSLYYELEHDKNILGLSNYYNTDINGEEYFNLSNSSNKIQFKVKETVDSFKLLLQERYNNNEPLKVYYVLNNISFDTISFPDFEIKTNNITVCDDKTLCASNKEVEFD